MTAALWTEQLHNVVCSLWGMLIFGTKQQKVKRSEEWRHTIKPQRRLLSVRATKVWKAQYQAQVKTDHRATMRENITSREKGLNAVGKNYFLSEQVWRPMGRTHFDSGLKHPSTWHFPNALQKTFPYHEAQPKAAIGLKPYPSPLSLFLFTHHLLLWRRDYDHNPPLEPLSCRRQAFL